MADEEKKIIVDDDWKQQAQKEKEELQKQEKEELQKQEKEELQKQEKEELQKQEKEELQKEEKAVEETPPEAGERPPLPPANFPGLVSMLATQVFFALGLIASEQNKDAQLDMEMAKFNIDMLTVLQEKTKGNLESEEEKMLTDTLSQLRMAFVQVSKKD